MYEATENFTAQDLRRFLYGQEITEHEYNRLATQDQVRFRKKREVDNSSYSSDSSYSSPSSESFSSPASGPSYDNNPRHSFEGFGVGDGGGGGASYDYGDSGGYDSGSSDSGGGDSGGGDGGGGGSD